MDPRMRYGKSQRLLGARVAQDDSSTAGYYVDALRFAKENRCHCDAAWDLQRDVVAHKVDPLNEGYRYHQ